MTPWEIDALEVANCNCAVGCPCQFNALPTHGSCEAAVAIIINKGFHGDTRLDGLKVAATAKWPGAIHQGNGTMQFVVDPAATPAQKTALETIFSGGDTEDMATVFWVFNKMTSTVLETLVKPIEAEIDIQARRGRVRVADVFELDAGPIINPVTGMEHRARIDLPHGFEYRQAEVAVGTTKTKGAIQLENNQNTHAHLCRLLMNGKGVIEHAV